VRNLSIIIPVKNEEEKLSNIIKEVKKLDPLEIIVIVNGSTDQTKQIAESLNCEVIEYTESLGHDIGRAIGAFYAKGDILLFIDGDIVIPHKELIPFINAIQEGHDIALNNLESILEINQRPHSVSIAKMAVNGIFGNSVLSINSLVAIPHAISRHALQEIGWINLGEPPRAQGIAMKKNLSFSCPTFVDVISPNKIRKELHLEKSQETPYKPLEDIIFGDHLSAVQYLIEGYGERGEWIDNRNREMLKNIKIGKRKKFVKRSAVVSYESNENVTLLLDIIQSLQRSGAEEIIVLSSNDVIKKINTFDPIVKVIPLEVNAGPYINRAIGAAFSTGENILFTDGQVLSSVKDYETLFREMEKGVDVALFDVSDILDGIQPIDEMHSIQYFLNIILRKPEFFNNGLTYTPHVISKEVIEQVGYSSLMIPALAYVKIIENNYKISLVCSDQKGLTARKNEHSEILLGDHVEALKYFLSKTNERGNFSSGKKNFRVLDELSKNHNVIGRVFE
jgi:glycosyltransferase involved in cell wall biosynthesis